MTNQYEARTITVATQNILLDKTRTEAKSILPQDDRIAAIARDLHQVPGALDVVGIQEAHKSKMQHNGQILAELAGYGLGEWAQHNEKPYPKAPRGRSGEYVGLFGAEVDGSEAIDLGDRRKALLTEIAGVAFVTFHLRAGASLRSVFARRHNANRLMEALESYDDAVIFGDMNEPNVPVVAGARATIRKNGFESVFPLTNQPKPTTFPTPSYAGLYGARREFNLDDIYIRGNIRVIGAGVVRHMIETKDETPHDSSFPAEPTDHYGLYATLRLHSPRYD